MIERMMEAFKRPSRLIFFIGSIAVFVLETILAFSRIDGGFFQVFTGIIILLATMIATGSIPVLLILKKDEAVKLIFNILALYWLIDNTMDDLHMSVLIYSEFGAIHVCEGVFSVLFALSFLTIMVIIVVQYIFKEAAVAKIAFVTFLIAILFGLVLMIIELATDSRAGFGWPAYCIDIVTDFVIPVTLLFGVMHLYVNDL